MSVMTARPKHLPPRLDLMRSRGDRILWLISTVAWGLYSTGEVNIIPDSIQDKGEEWVKRIRELVADDRRKHVSERIDSVVWRIEAWEEPSAVMWQALDGLSPEHLQIYCGFDEGCNVEPLDTLRHPWTKLKTFSLANNIDDLFSEHHKTLSHITCLSLDHCCFNGDPLPPHATQLKELHIFKNDARETFCWAVDSDQNPGLVEQLEVLEIHAPWNMRSYGLRLDDFNKRLQRCTNLRQLTYVEGEGLGFEVSLAEYIPPGVETLTLVSDRSVHFLRELDNWIQQASNPTWLPHLTSFSLTTDPKSHVRDLKPDQGGSRNSRKLAVGPPASFTTHKFDQEFDVKKRKLYEALQSVKPELCFPA